MSYLAALPGAVATIVGLAGLRVFAGLVFEPLIASNAVSYGVLRTVLIVQSWLIGTDTTIGSLVGARNPVVASHGSATQWRMNS